METYTLQLGGLSDAQHIAETLELPVLPHLGAVAECRRALDLCAASRVGVAVSGPKGSGKSVGLDLGYRWFGELEREKRRRDNAYVIRRVLRLRAVRSKTDREVILLVAKHLSPAYSDRARGRRKGVPEIRADVLQMCRKQQYALIAVDEAETYSDAALECLRDLLTDAHEEGTGRVTAGGVSAAAGLGLLLVGDETLRERLGYMREAGHRWRQVIDVPSPELGHVIEVYRAWFPGFQEHVAALGEVAWSNHISSVICRGRVPSLRFLENHARLYAHYMARTRSDIGSREEIPFDPHLFQLAADECAWANGMAAKVEGSTGGKGKARGRTSARRSA